MSAPTVTIRCSPLGPVTQVDVTTTALDDITPGDTESFQVPSEIPGYVYKWWPNGQGKTQVCDRFRCTGATMMANLPEFLARLKRHLSRQGYTVEAA